MERDLSVSSGVCRSNEPITGGQKNLDPFQFEAFNKNLLFNFDHWSLGGLITFQGK